MVHGPWRCGFTPYPKRMSRGVGFNHFLYDSETWGFMIQVDRLAYFIKWVGKSPTTLPKTNISHENGCLEYEFPFGKPYYFQVQTVSPREGRCLNTNKTGLFLGSSTWYPWDGGPLTINPKYIPYIVGISWFLVLWNFSSQTIGLERLFTTCIVVLALYIVPGWNREREGGEPRTLACLVRFIQPNLTEQWKKHPLVICWGMKYYPVMRGLE